MWSSRHRVSPGQLHYALGRFRACNILLSFFLCSHRQHVFSLSTLEAKEVLRVDFSACYHCLLNWTNAFFVSEYLIERAVPWPTSSKLPLCGDASQVKNWQVGQQIHWVCFSSSQVYLNSTFNNEHSYKAVAESFRCELIPTSHGIGTEFLI